VCLQNYGLAVGNLIDPSNILIKTTKLKITAWSDGWVAYVSPGVLSSEVG